MTPWEKHRAKWIKCERCDLCERRKQVVLLRGSLPAPILFIGEGPGDGEDVIGKPFVGPAGKLLDKMLNSARIPPNVYAITNLIGCVPKDENRTKIHKPPGYAIAECAERLREVYTLCKPKLVIFVGGVAETHGPRSLQGLIEPSVVTMSITHPSAILQAHISQKGLMVQRNIVALSDAYEDLIEGSNSAKT